MTYLVCEGELNKKKIFVTDPHKLSQGVVGTGVIVLGELSYGVVKLFPRYLFHGVVAL